MALIPVNGMTMTVADDGNCTLIEAIVAANNNTTSGNQAGECPAGTENDVIQLLNGATYTLTTVDNNTNGPNGLPSITGRITIEGQGATIERSMTDGTPPFRLFHIAETGSLTLESVMIANGLTVVNDDDVQQGGGIFNQGILTILNSTLYQNQTIGEKGGDGSPAGGGGAGGGAGGLGGGLFNDGGLVTIQNSTFSGNQAVGGDGGQGFSSGILTSGTGGDGGGPGGTGGIPGLPGGPGDFGGGGGGGSGTKIAGTSGGEAGFGGGGGGGGAKTSGGLGGLGGNGTLDGGAGGQSKENGGGGGGGGAGLGGAIFNNGGTVIIDQSTLAYNSATGGSGGEGTLGQGNGQDGVGLGGALYHNGGTTTVKNTVLADSLSGGDCGINGDSEGDIISQGYNIVSDDSCPAHFTEGGDLTNSDPKLGDLANNGGLTLTHALRSGSPALNAITETEQCEIDRDQRGTVRPQGEFCDIGAYEVRSGSTTLLKVLVGPAPESDWQFNLNGTLLTTLAPTGGEFTFESISGSQTLEEVTKPGYDVNVTCGDITEEGSRITIEPALDEETICTFVNTAQAASITVSKTVIGERPDSNWEFQLNNKIVASVDPGGGDQILTLEPDVYTLREVPKPGYEITVECSNARQGGVGVTFPLAPGENVACNFTAVRQANSITIIKETIPANVEGFVFEGDLESFVLDDGDIFLKKNISSGSYRVSELKSAFPDPYWSLLYVTCQAQIAGGDLTSFTPVIEETPFAFTATIPFESGQDVVCTFHNERSTYQADPIFHLFLPIIQ